MSKLEQTSTGMRLRASSGISVDLPLKTEDRGDGAVRLLEYIDAHLGRPGVQVRAGERLSYGSWELWFAGTEGSALSVQEASITDPDARVNGASTALKLWESQRLECERWRSPHAPPTAVQLVAVSAGVQKGEPVEGVRYEAPAHMSGWFLTTSSYDGNIGSLRTVHLYHLIQRRPELARFLALGAGFFFRTQCGGPTEVGQS
jgi:hypothetical protein